MEDFSTIATPVELRPPPLPKADFASIAYDPYGHAKAVAIANGPANAASAGSAAKIAKQLGIPQVAVETDLPSFTTKAKVEKNTALLDQNPILARWVAANPDAARVANDDYEKLSLVEKTFDAAKNVGYGTAQGLGGAYSATGLALNRTIAPVASLVGAGDWWQRQMIAPLEENQRVFSEQGGFAQALGQVVGSLGGMLSQIMFTGGGQVEIPKTAGVMTNIALSVQNAMKSMAIPAATAAVNTGADVYKATGGDPLQTMKASAISAANMIGIGVVPLSKAGNLWQRTYTGAIANAAQSEATRGAWNIVMPEQFRRQFDPQQFATDVATGAVMGAIMGPRPDVNAPLQEAMREVYKKSVDAQQAIHVGETMDTVTDIVKDINLKKASPEDFARFMQGVTEKTALEAVYVDPAVFGEALAQSKLDVNTMPDVAKQLADPVPGGDVRISVADFVTHIAGTDAQAALTPHLKASPDGMTRSEGESFYKNLAPEMEKRAKELSTLTEEQQKYQAETEEIRTLVYNELTEGGKRTSAVARVLAKETETFFSALASRVPGANRLAMFKRYGAQVVTNALDGNPLEQVVVNTDTPEFKAWFSGSRVVDESGAPMVVYHGTDGDFSEFKIGSNFIEVAYFSDSPYIAGGYTGTRGSIIPAYIKMSNPLVVDAKGANWRFIDFEGEKTPTGILSYEARSRGHDGVIIRNVVDYRNSDPTPATTYIVFRPEQIKSIFNRGTFDPNDPNILNQVLPAAVTTSKKLSPNLNVIGTPDIDALRSNTVQMEKAVDAVLSDPGMTGPDATFKSVDEKVRYVVGRMVDNLLWLHDQMPEAIRTRAKLWYDGASAISDRWAVKWGKTKAQTAGMLAVLSPQKDWFMNTTLGERVGDILKEQGSHRWDDKMDAAAFKFLLSDAGKADPDAAKNTLVYERANGKTLNEILDIGNPRLTGLWIRAYDEAYNSPSHAVITPEGGFAEPQMTGAGEEARRAWGDFTSIGKAASIFIDGSVKNISANLGSEHKVRNFYNNIFNPADPRFTTIDTHAVAAAQLRPLAGADKAVADNFGATGSDAVTGISGSYPLYYEAYKLAAEARGILPREMQSITWEAVRGLFKDTFKTKANKEAVDLIWSEFSAGKITLEDARAKINEMAGGIAKPTWWKGEEAHLTEALNDTTYAKQRDDPAGIHITFEVAPDPKDTALKSAWDALDPNVKAEISHRIGWNISAKALANLFQGPAFKPEKIAKGELHQQFGAYGPDSNPSLSIWLDQGVSGNKAMTLAKVLGYALRQESMMVTSLKKFTDAEHWGAAIIRVGDMDAKGVETLYNELRSAVPGIEGHTTAAGDMAILVPLDAAGRLTQDIAAHLGDRYDVHEIGVHVAWPKNGIDDYGLPRQTDTSAGGGAAEGSPVRAYADQLRSEATRQFSEAIAARGPRTLSPLGTEHGLADEIARFEGEGGTALEQDKRAQIKLPLKADGTVDFDQGRPLLALLKDANLSSYFHELGHLFVEVYSDVVFKGDAPLSIKRDLQILLDYAGIKDNETWRSMTINQKRIAHEKIAESFEQYLWEGKAPSVELRGVFRKIKSWMKAIYKSMRGLGIELTPEVRGVFDRMLASDAAIAEANAKYPPLFKTAEEAGMTPSQFEDYMNLDRDKVDAALEEDDARQLQNMKWLSGAKSRTLREMQRKGESLRTEVRNEVTEEVDQMPVFRALDDINQSMPAFKERLDAWKADSEAVKRQAQESVIQTEADAEQAARAWDESHPQPQKPLPKGEKDVDLVAARKRQSILKSIAECLT